MLITTDKNDIHIQAQLLIKSYLSSKEAQQIYVFREKLTIFTALIKYFRKLLMT